MKLSPGGTCVWLICFTPQAYVVDQLIMIWPLYYREIQEDEKVEQALTDGK